ncbi:MAG: hypothetical protein LC114_18030 [Bryobacterales bacterium]|nr:hypothetical protein [Bryobacterales bacterium]
MHRLIFVLFIAAISTPPVFAKPCTLSATVYMVSNAKSKSLPSDEEILTPLTDYVIELYGSAKAKMIRLNSDRGYRWTVPCDISSYTIFAGGLSYAKGTVDMIHTNHIHIVSFLSVVDIESDMNSWAALLKLRWINTTSSQDLTITFASIDGRGTFRARSADAGNGVIEVPNRTYAVLVMSGARILSTNLMYLAPGETQLEINGETGAVSIVRAASAPGTEN